MQRDAQAYRTGELESLRAFEREYRPTRRLDQIRRSLEQQPTRSIAETCRRIAAITRVVRRSTQVSRFLKCLGLKWNAVVIALAGQLGITLLYLPSYSHPT